MSFGPSPYVPPSVNSRVLPDPSRDFEDNSNSYNNLFSPSKRDDEGRRSPGRDVSSKSLSSKTPDDSSLRHSWNQQGFNINSKEGRRRVLLGMKRTVNYRRALDEEEDESKSRNVDDSEGWYLHSNLVISQNLNFE